MTVRLLPKTCWLDPVEGIIQELGSLDQPLEANSIWARLGQLHIYTSLDKTPQKGDSAALLNPSLGIRV
jgi:hypothetical protein